MRNRLRLRSGIVAAGIVVFGGASAARADVGAAVVALIGATEATATLFEAVELILDAAGRGPVRRISQGLEGEPNASSREPRVSRNAERIVFFSFASNLVPGLVTPFNELIYSATAPGTITLVSTDEDGKPGQQSFEPAISADGSHIAFHTATDLFPSIEDLTGEVLYIQSPGGLERPDISTDPDLKFFGIQGQSLSTDGRFVAFVADTNLIASDTRGEADVYRFDRTLEVAEIMSVNDGGAQAGDLTNSDFAQTSISGDGNRVAFVSRAPGLTDDPLGNVFQIFVRDTNEGTTTLVSRGIDGLPADKDCFRPQISESGCCVVFESGASNLVDAQTNPISDVYFFDLDTPGAGIERISRDFLGDPPSWRGMGPQISGDGRFVAFASPSRLPGQPSGPQQVYVRDRLAGQTRLVSRNALGERGDDLSGDDGLGISPEGDWIVFSSFASNLVAAGDTNGWSDIYLAPNPFTSP